MRVPQSPHTLRKFVSTSSDSDSSDSDVQKSEKSGMKPPKPFSKKKELRSENTGEKTGTTGTFVSANRGRERTRISAVQRLVERKMAQKEKEREKERDTLFRRSSSVGSNLPREKENLSRSLSRERLNSDTSKTYIRISSQNSSIREVSPTKKPMEPKLGLGQPLKSAEILQNLQEPKKPENNPEPPVKKQERKISFTTEKTIGQVSHCRF